MEEPILKRRDHPHHHLIRSDIGSIGLQPPEVSKELMAVFQPSPSPA